MAEKTKSNEKKIAWEKNFDFEIFVLKYVSKHSESIPPKKNFDQNFLILSFFDYFGHFGRKNKVPRKNFTPEKILISRLSV